MVRLSLFAAAVLAVASPLAAQSALPEPEDWTWTSQRPDANALIGVFAPRTLDAGEFEASYRFEQTNDRGVWYQQDSLALDATLGVYDDAPLTLTDIRHHVRIGYGVTDDFTLVARGEFAVLQRQTIANNGLLRTGVNDIGDVEVGALYDVFRSGAYRLNIQVGGIIPTGASTTYADTTSAQTGTEVPLSYDMRPGGGTFGVVGAASGNVQNEVGSLGAQFRMLVNVGENDDGYTPGDQYEANAWAAYNVNSSIAVLAGLRWQDWDHITGADARLNPTGDPMNNAPVLAGKLTSMPLGVNLMLPEGSRFAGHRLSLEAVWALHHDYEGPQLGMDWGLNFGWAYSF